MEMKVTKKTCLHGGVRDAKVNSDDDSGIRKEVFEEVNKPSTPRGRRCGRGRKM